MITDPTIDRIRATRHKISEACNHETKKLVEYYMKYQQRYADRLIRKNAPPKKEKYNPSPNRTQGATDS